MIELLFMWMEFRLEILNMGYIFFFIIKEFNVVFLRWIGFLLIDCMKVDFWNVVLLNFMFFIVELNI